MYSVAQSEAEQKRTARLMHDYSNTTYLVLPVNSTLEYRLVHSVMHNV